MKKEFIPYELALRMKQLGFDEPCFGFHSPIHDLMICNTTSVNEIAGECLAPTYSQAFRWFREEHHLAGLISIGSQEYTYEIWNEKDGKSGKMISRFNPDGTYEEAELACLEKLIEIVQEKPKQR